ncbi:TPA: hypothetical protein NKY06_001472 [Vibrio parahaemolyticus]|nr:hypothetical protein [Vibrio parahaemolyticus]HCH5062470.1 hypothetical protein [Vibrio parahaemolyticus]
MKVFRFLMSLIKLILCRLSNRFSVDRGNNVTIDANLAFCKIKVKGRNNKILITSQDSEVKIKKLTINIEGNDNFIKIENPRVISSLVINVKDLKNSIIIKKDTGISASRVVCCGNGKTVSIGEGVMIADYCEIWNCDTHSILDKNTKERLNPSGNIEIGDKVWLGRSVSVYKNAIISKGSVIGAGSHVFKGIYDEHCIYAGTPAVKIKDNIEWVIERI